MRRALVLRPCAKINLTLQVGAKRSDGFHEVRTVLQSVALADRLTFTLRRGPFVLSSRAQDLPLDRANLVYRAAELLWRTLGRGGAPSDVHVALEKRIPVSAGLGGGSADAAATLVGLNRLWNARRSPRDLARLGAELGADVPFFLQGGTALGLGRGDDIHPLDDIRDFTVIIVKPAFGVSTADAYRWLDEDRRRSPSAGGAGSAGARPIDVGWPGGPIEVANDLQPPVSARHPAIDDIADTLLEAGAAAAAMTGSGSAVFGLFARPVARTDLARLARPGWRVIRTRTRRRARGGAWKPL
jgi:4-diphosphocytidyl-2-C-methyl-D-erythritol kinase